MRVMSELQFYVCPSHTHMYSSEWARDTELQYVLSRHVYTIRLHGADCYCRISVLCVCRNYMSCIIWLVSVCVVVCGIPNQKLYSVMCVQVMGSPPVCLPRCPGWWMYLAQGLLPLPLAEYIRCGENRVRFPTPPVHVMVRTCTYILNYCHCHFVSWLGSFAKLGYSAPPLVTCGETSMPIQPFTYSNTSSSNQGSVEHFT